MTRPLVLCAPALLERPSGGTDDLLHWEGQVSALETNPSAFAALPLKADVGQLPGNVPHLLVRGPLNAAKFPSRRGAENLAIGQAQRCPAACLGNGAPPGLNQGRCGIHDQTWVTPVPPRRTLPRKTTESNQPRAEGDRSKGVFKWHRRWTGATAERRSLFSEKENPERLEQAWRASP